jgi:hypothetical protein
MRSPEVSASPDQGDVDPVFVAPSQSILGAIINRILVQGPPRRKACALDYASG